tara:strand:+ start:26874 stop:27227 length:354 start_codon:yes stop_codon:yes gene_type:complete
MNKFINAITGATEKSASILFLMLVVTLYLFVRTASLPLWERLTSALLSAAMAFSFSDRLTPWFNGSESAAVIFIMILGPFVVGVVLNASKDEEFVKRIMREWVRKRLGLKGDDDAGS